jgi:hypothetical protein
MTRQKKISFSAKFLSIRHYLNEVSVEGQRTDPTQRKLGNYDKYVAQVIRAGNCVTLLRESYPIGVKSFWNINHFEKFAKSVFWTFNKSFLLKLIDQVDKEKPLVLHRCRELLQEYPVAYPDPMPEDADDELQVCYLKNASLKENTKFHPLYALDEQNRKTFLEAVERRIAALSPSPSPSSDSAAIDDPPVKPEPPEPISFLSLVRPMNGSADETIQFITDQVKQAGFPFALFSKVDRLPNGKNRYGLNGAMAAMVRFFYDRNYFNKEYEFVDVFTSYLHFTGNSVGKLPTFLENYQEDGHFQKYFDKLKDLKISKLS